MTFDEWFEIQPHPAMSEQEIAEMRRDYKYAWDAALKHAPPEAERSVWAVDNKTSLVLFATEYGAQHYCSSFGASVGGGMRIIELPVRASPPQQQRIQEGK